MSGKSWVAGWLGGWVGRKRVLKLRVVARNGSVAYVVLPRNVDPVDAANVLTGGSHIGKSDWQPGPWLDTEGGGRIRADVIEQV